MSFAPLNKMTFPERIAREIQMQILNGELTCGTRLPAEIELASKFSVSRTVIREAVRILSGLGLVEIKKGSAGGIFITNGYHKPLSDSLRGLVDSGRVSVDHIFMVRLLIEPNVAAEAARFAAEEDIEALRALLQESEQKVDDAVFLGANRGRFHIRLAQATGNPVLEMFMQSLIELLREYFYDFNCIEFEQYAVKSHWKILEAVQNRQPETARDMMAADILKIKSLVRDMDKSIRTGV